MVDIEKWFQNWTRNEICMSRKAKQMHSYCCHSRCSILYSMVHSFPEFYHLHILHNCLLSNLRTMVDRDYLEQFFRFVNTNTDWWESNVCWEIWIYLCDINVVCCSLGSYGDKKYVSGKMHVNHCQVSKFVRRIRDQIEKSMLPARHWPKNLKYL